MLADVGCRLVIVGHSERRHGHGEDDRLVRAKAAAGHAAGLIVVLCVGETEAERDAGATIAVLDRQLEGSLPERCLGREPGGRLRAGLGDRNRAHAERRRHRGRACPSARAPWRAGPTAATALRLLYGGSVKPANAGEIMAIADVDGVLVGGASLDAGQFDAIYSAGQRAAARPPGA